MCVFVCAEVTHNVLQHSDRVYVCVCVCRGHSQRTAALRSCVCLCVQMSLTTYCSTQIVCVFVCEEVTHIVLQHSDRVCVCVCLCVQRSCDRKVNEFVKRARAAKIHILIVSVVGGCEWV